MPAPAFFTIFLAKICEVRRFLHKYAVNNTRFLSHLTLDNLWITFVRMRNSQRSQNSAVVLPEEAQIGAKSQIPNFFP